MRSRFVAMSVACLLALLQLMGCGGGGGEGNGTISLMLTDAPISGIEKVEITISKIYAHQSGGSGTLLKEYDSPVTVNLLDYRYDGTDESTYQLLSDTPLTPGHYQWIRLELTKASVTISGQTHDLDLTNIQQNGLKFNRQFTVAEGTKVGLLLDFNAVKSIKESGGNYTIQPVTAMMPVVLAGSVKGVVQLKDSNSNTITVPENATIDAYKTGETTLANSGLIASDGSFAIPALEAGIYNLKIAAEGYQSIDIKTAVVVSSGDQTDIGTVDVTMIPAP